MLKFTIQYQSANTREDCWVAGEGLEEILSININNITELKNHLILYNQNVKN